MIKKGIEDSVGTIRAFIAIPLPDYILSFAGDYQNRLKNENIKASWPSPSNLHLTLAFLGNISPLKLNDIQKCMTAAIGSYKHLYPLRDIESQNSTPGLLLSAGGIGFFPSVKNPRVIWTGILGQTGRLEKIQSLLTKQLIATGFAIEQKRFYPHLTLGRVKYPLADNKIRHLFKNYADRVSNEFYAASMILYKSELSPSGARYTKLISENFNRFS